MGSFTLKIQKYITNYYINNSSISKRCNTSQKYHKSHPKAPKRHPKNDAISASIFDEGNYISIEFAGILKNSKNKIIANDFLKFILSDDFQSVIPSTNIMYPVTSISNLPDAFNNLSIPKVIQLNPKEINDNKENWINEWLNAF